MFALPSGTHAAIAGDGATYAVNAFIKSDRHCKHFDRHAAQLALPLTTACFPTVPPLSRAHVRIGNVRAVVTVTHDDEIVGQLLVSQNGRTSYLLRAVGVRADHRRRGVANLLIRATIDKVLRPDFDVQIRVNTYDPHAAWLLAWYARLGFVPDPVTPVAAYEHRLVLARGSQ